MAEISIGNMTFSFGGRLIQPMPAAGPATVDYPSKVAGSYTATGEITLCKESWQEFMAVSGSRRPAEPPSKYRVVHGSLQMSGGGELEVRTANGQSFQGTPWFEIGTTRGPEGTDRLRKFVRRAGRLVEVRTRGRTGVRSLAMAVEQAGTAGLVMGGGQITITARQLVSAPLKSEESRSS